MIVGTLPTPPAMYKWLILSCLSVKNIISGITATLVNVNISILCYKGVLKQIKAILGTRATSPLTGIWSWIGLQLDWLCWWMDHYSNAADMSVHTVSASLCFVAKGTHICVSVCALWMSLLFPVRVQAGYLAGVSQPLLLNDKLYHLSAWMIERGVFEYVCQCVS